MAQDASTPSACKLDDHGFASASRMPSAAGRVMVVDDEALLRALLLDCLTVQGYEVAAFGSGAEALHAVSTFQPDVIVVDMRMPGLSGTQVRDELQRKGVTVPVILISGTPEPTDSGGFFAALKKPFNLTTVAEVVAAAVNHRRTATGPVARQGREMASDLMYLCARIVDIIRAQSAALCAKCLTGLMANEGSADELDIRVAVVHLSLSPGFASGETCGGCDLPA